MAYQGPLPAGDSEFDVLQSILVKAVIAKGASWQIPNAERTKLTSAQAPWTNAWAIAKDKMNSTTTQKKNKDLARKSYTQVLRPFIQKWIYRNENMDAAAVEICGLKPRKSAVISTGISTAVKVNVKYGVKSEFITSCPVVGSAKYYGCIMVEGAPLPEWFSITTEGKLVFTAAKFNPEKNKVIKIQTDLTVQRIKHFTGIKPGTLCYFYYYVVNNAGVSPISQPVSLVC